MALTFIGWSSWEVKLAMLDLLAMMPPNVRRQRTAIGSLQNQHQQQQVPAEGSTGGLTGGSCRDTSCLTVYLPPHMVQSRHTEPVFYSMVTETYQ